MDLINEVVIHATYGRGIVKNCDGVHITANFNGVDKIFQYPEAFQRFLAIEKIELKPTIDAEIKGIKEKKNMEEQQNYQKELEKAREKEKERFEKPAKKKRSSEKAVERSNIAFKCNYCDGGKKTEQIGFCGICSDQIIKYNIDVEKRSWCSDKDSPCRQYRDGLISRRDLDNMCNEDEESFVCYESQMLRDWRAFAGVSHNGIDSGKPLKIKKVQCNSLAVLTTREPNAKEEDRIIFGLFIVDDAFEGDNYEAGEVSTTSEYKIKLSLEEARKMKFWKYYFNPNKPETIKMGQGLFRYLTDEQSVQIIQDIIKVKEKEPDREFAAKFLDYYSRVNHIDLETIMPPLGVLIR